MDLNFAGIDPTAETNTKLKRAGGSGDSGRNNARRQQVSSRWGNSTEEETLRLKLYYSNLLASSANNFIWVPVVQPETQAVSYQPFERQNLIKAGFTSAQIAAGAVALCAVSGKLFDAFSNDAEKNSLHVDGQAVGNLGSANFHAKMDRARSAAAGLEKTAGLGTFQTRGFTSWDETTPQPDNDHLELEETAA